MRRALRRTFTAMTPIERWALGCFVILFGLSLIMLLKQFYEESTEAIPHRGGTYIEGSVGTLRMLNPWFTVTNDVNRDVTSLVFAGLQRYNPFTGEIEDDLAQVSISGGGRVYIAKLRPDLLWHDSTEEQPKPVTADDVIFTYQTIKQQGFPNPIWQKNVRGVEIEKIDDLTVQFRLERPYAFFKSNLTLGILPKHHLEGIPADRLIEAYGFNLHPIGCGPYKFKSLVETDLATEVTLEQFSSYHGAQSYIDRLVFRAFPDYPSLLSDLRNLDGVRHVPRDKEGRAIIPKRYRTFYYSLPQYVALFFNTNRSILSDSDLRLALQLATNKHAIVEKINESVIVDTPLLEFAAEDWQYQFTPQAAQGALYESDWHLPEKVRLQHLQINRAKNLTGALSIAQSIVLLETGAQLTVTGVTVPGILEQLKVNNAIVTYTNTGTWTVSLSTDGSTGSVLLGENWIRLTTSGGKVLDTFVLTRSADRSTYRALREEQKILDLFMQREEDGIQVSDLRIENGTLRLRKKNEHHGVRVHDDGTLLQLTLLTSPVPPTYQIVAEELAAQWREIGVEVTVEVPEQKKDFEQQVINRKYDVLLFGQSLLDNLDSYPYWHSSQIQTFELNEETGKQQAQKLDAHNLSQFASFKADTLLEQARENHNGDVRKRALEQLRDVFLEDVPAVVLYSPTYVFAVSEDILGVDLGKPSLHSDRFLSIHRWFIKQKRTFRAGRNWLSFFGWMTSLAK